MTNRLQNGGYDDGKKYKYNQCEYENKYNIKNCCIECELNSMVDFYKTKNKDIINKLSLEKNYYNSSNISNMVETDKNEIFYIGYYYPKNPDLSLCLFIKGDNLAAVRATNSGIRDVNIYKLSPDLVTELVNDNFLPIEYAPPGYSPPEPEINTNPVINNPLINNPVINNPVINNKLPKKKTGLWNRFWKSEKNKKIYL